MVDWPTASPRARNQSSFMARSGQRVIRLGRVVILRRLHLPFRHAPDLETGLGLFEAGLGIEFERRGALAARHQHDFITTMQPGLRGRVLKYRPAEAAIAQAGIGDDVFDQCVGFAAPGQVWNDGKRTTGGKSFAAISDEYAAAWEERQSVQYACGIFQTQFCAAWVQLFVKAQQIGKRLLIGMSDDQVAFRVAQDL
jgi:hypothetical protein